MESAEIKPITDEIFMQRALQLATSGMGNVSPNPMVGCVIALENKIIGEGFHKKYGDLHAEPSAIQAVKDQSLLSKSTLYVNLEPCSHWGKTPPCADLIIEKKIPRVVICNQDPNPLVAGKGIEKLKNEGIEVKIGILEKEGTWLNRRFFTFQIKKRPYVILKWAQTQDGFIAKENFDSKWISNVYSRQLVHKWRSEEAAILVGFNTAKYDNPQLNVRDIGGNNPIRVLIDKNLEIPSDYRLYNQSQKTIVFNSQKSGIDGLVEYIRLDDFKNYNFILSALFESKIQSVIVEGGAKTIQQLINQNLWDEARIFTANTYFENGIKAPSKPGKLISEENISGDKLEIRINGQIQT